LRTQKGLIYDYAAEIEVEKDRIGVVRVGFSRKRLQNTINRLLLTATLLTLGVVALGVLIASLFARSVTRRIQRLRDSAEKMVKGDLEIQTGPELEENCWQIMDCRAEDCPAYAQKGLRCWDLVGTLCSQAHPDRFAPKWGSCRDCPVFKRLHGDEIQDLAEAFDVMAASIKSHVQQISTAEQKLARQKEILRTILDVTPDLVSLQDENLVYQTANKAFCDYFQISESELVGKDDSYLFSEKNARQFFEEDREILKSKKPLSKEIMVQDKGQKRWFHVLKVPVLEGEKIVGLLLTARDITEVKNYQQQLVQAQKMEHLGHLAGGVAHEINTPLGIILGYAQLLMDDVPEDSQMAEDLATIERQTQVCRKIVADLLKFSRSSEPVKAEVELNKSLQEVCSLVEHTFGLSQIEIIRRMQEDLPKVEADVGQLKQVWMNLLNNAAAAIGSTGWILIQTGYTADEQKVLVVIADSGPGISDEDVTKIFDPFYSTKPVGEGTGLGLSVSIGVIRDHGGQIWVKSPVPDSLRPAEKQINSGPGAAFFVSLPVNASS
jgi:PAS domain S-box-containing protein